MSVTKLRPEANTSGLHPLGHRVLVKVDEYMEKTVGGIIIPDMDEKSQNSQTAGYVVEVGPTAFTHPDFGNGTPYFGVGDRVVFSRYNGMLYKGKDNATYRVFNDMDPLLSCDEDMDFDLDSTY